MAEQAGDDVPDPLGLGAPQDVPSKARRLPLFVGAAAAAVLVAIIVALTAGGVLAGWSGLMSAAAGFCPKAPTAPPGVMAPAQELAASVAAMPGVRSATPTVTKRSPGVCASAQAYDSEPWNTHLNVTMAGDGTADQVGAVADRVGASAGGTITLLRSAGMAQLMLDLPPTPGAPLPLADARQLGAIPGATSVIMPTDPTAAASRVIVSVDRLAAIPQVRAAVASFPTWNGALFVSDGDRFRTSFAKTGGVPPATVDALLAVAESQPQATFDLLPDQNVEVRAPTRDEARSVADALAHADLGSAAQGTLTYHVAYGPTGSTSFGSGVVGSARG